MIVDLQMPHAPPGIYDGFLGSWFGVNGRAGCACGSDESW